MGRPHGRRAELLPLAGTKHPALPGRRYSASGIALGALFVWALFAPPAASSTPLERFLGAVSAYHPIDADLRATIARDCTPADLRCAARAVAAKLGPAARLERVNHPDTDSIRRVVTTPSVTTVTREDSETTRIVLARFERKADRELLDLFPAGVAFPERIILDLRDNHGGDLDRMRRVAALFAGAKQDAIRLISGNTVRSMPLPRPPRILQPTHLEVWVGSETASSAEILAALLRRHAGATVRGARTRGKDHLIRIVPIDHDWRLLMPAERVEVPGETIRGGLAPDAPLNGD